jgi:hypothetical protein
MAALRASDPALRRGEQVVRAYGDNPGLFAISRRAPSGGGETLVAFNTGSTPISANVVVDAGSMRLASSHGRCAPRSSARRAASGSRSRRSTTSSARHCPLNERHARA